MTQNVSLKCTAVKHFSCKNPRWLTDDTLERPVLHHREILFFFGIQDGGCPPWIFEIKIFNSRVL